MAGEMIRERVVADVESGGVLGQSLQGVPLPDPAELARDLETIRRPIEEATTLPARFYTDAGIYRLEHESIFRKMWLCIAREEDLPNPGDYLTQSIGLASVVLMRDATGRVNAFHNVCSGGYDRGRLSTLEWMGHEFDKFIADQLTGTKGLA